MQIKRREHMANNIKVVSDNRRASFDYYLEDRYEAGIELKGTEIKSIRKGSCSIKDSYVQIKNGEAFIINMNIPIYDKGNIFNHEPTRTRKLLLHKREINRLFGYVKEKGYTLIPTKVYLKNGLAKVEFALAKGKKNYDKREVEKQKAIARDLAKAKKIY
jgi:SsrA-binding protein